MNCRATNQSPTMTISGRAYCHTAIQTPGAWIGQVAPKSKTSAIFSTEDYRDGEETKLL